MCGRFVVQDAPAIPARFDASVSAVVQPLLIPRFNVAPTQQTPIVVEPESGARRVLGATWGLTPRRGKGGGKPFVLFNARAETLLERSSFRRLLPGGRCLVPADGFYEWEKVGAAKLPWLYRLKEAGLFAFAGLYERWLDGDGREVVACAVITTAPNEIVLPVHDRMPVILPRDAEANWLDPAAEARELLPLLTPYAAGGMDRTAVSPAVNSGRLDDARLIAPIAA